MKFQLKEILPNPYRDFDENPIDEVQVEKLIESVETTEFWNRLDVRLNAAGRPELAGGGHHRLEALRRVYKPTDEFDFTVIKLTDAGMIQRMSRENNRRETSVAQISEAIQAAVAAYGRGEIKKEEMPVVTGERQRSDAFRVAPSYKTSVTPAVTLPSSVYTIGSLAKFLGYVKPKSETPMNSFLATFGMLELIEAGLLTKSRIKGLDKRKLGEVVAAVKKQRDAALAEAVRLAAAAEKQKQEAARQAEAAKRATEEAEQRRVEAAKRLKEEQERGEKARIETAKRNLEKQQKAEAEAEQKRKAAAEATVAAKKKEAEAQKENKEATAHVKDVATRLADEAKTMNRDDIRTRGVEIAEEQAQQTGKHVGHRRKKMRVDAPTQAPQSSHKKAALRQTALDVANEGFKSLSKKHHPDLPGGSAEKQTELNAAIRWLRNLIEIAD